MQKQSFKKAEQCELTTSWPKARNIYRASHWRDSTSGMASHGKDVFEDLWRFKTVFEKGQAFASYTPLLFIETRVFAMRNSMTQLHFVNAQGKMFTRQWEVLEQNITAKKVQKRFWCSCSPERFGESSIHGRVRTIKKNFWKLLPRVDELLKHWAQINKLIDWAKYVYFIGKMFPKNKRGISCFKWHLTEIFFK